jgi:hypothetical protein
MASGKGQCRAAAMDHMIMATAILAGLAWVAAMVSPVTALFAGGIGSAFVSLLLLSIRMRRCLALPTPSAQRLLMSFKTARVGAGSGEVPGRNCPVSVETARRSADLAGQSWMRRLPARRRGQCVVIDGAGGGIVSVDLARGCLMAMRPPF